MSDIENILEIQKLYAEFHTYSGVVKALDGINLTIKKGETFGLVGETGCGKSVTANCVLQLIPTPPGKIPSGHIFFSAPKEKIARIKELQARLEVLESEGKDSPNAKERDDSIVELRNLYKEYDLLFKNREQMQKVRGNQISMIFQEPMSALNPVYTAGDQISELLLVHERHRLAKKVLTKIDQRLQEIDEYKRVSGNKVEGLDPGMIQCSACQTVVPETETRCPQCGGSFKGEPLRMLTKIKLRYNRGFYVKMHKDPRSAYIRYTSKIPILRRYNRMINDMAMEEAEEMLKLVRIPDPQNVVKSYPYELSGGMQQRVMIAMALACSPRLLIADEPTTALDVTIQAQILKLMKDIQHETGTSILLITHNLGVVAETCHRVGVMYAGVMAEMGKVEEIFKEPLHPYTQGLINSIPKLNSVIDRLEIIEGNVPNLIKPPSGCRFNPRCPYTMDICKKEKPRTIEVVPGHFVTCHLYEEVKK